MLDRSRWKFRSAKTEEAVEPEEPERLKPLLIEGGEDP